MKQILLLVFMAAFATAPLSAQKNFIQIGVTSVHDSDGLKGTDKAGNKYTFRMTGLDGPEIISPWMSKDQPGGRAAGDSLRAWIKGKVVLVDTLTIRGANQRDVYNRLLADVYFADSTSVSAKLVGLGLVWHSPEKNRRDRRVATVTLNLMKYAQNLKIGIWAKDQPRAIKPSTWRKKFSFRFNPSKV